MNQTREHIAFMEMLRRSDSTIFKICLMFTDRDPENVKDMYQDIVCSLWESWPRFRGQCKENTWVYSIAFNTAVSQVRHRSRSPMFLPLDDYLDRVPAREMGQALGITEAAVNHRIERIKDKLRTLNGEL